MILLPVFIMLLACFIFYSASKRAVYKRSPLNHWFLNRPLFSKAAVILLLLISFAFFIYLQGFGVGLFLGLTALMTVYGFMILFYPLVSRVKA